MLGFPSELLGRFGRENVANMCARDLLVGARSSRLFFAWHVFGFDLATEALVH